MGTGAQPGAALFLENYCAKVIAAFKGDDYRSTFVDNMAFGGYNKRFEPARTDKDWLTRDEKRWTPIWRIHGVRSALQSMHIIICSVALSMHRKKRILKKSQKICRCIWWQDQTIPLETSEKCGKCCKNVSGMWN